MVQVKTLYRKRGGMALFGSRRKHLEEDDSPDRTKKDSRFMPLGKMLRSLAFASQANADVPAADDRQPATSKPESTGDSSA